MVKELDPGIPNTSSALEDFNSILKRYTERKAKLISKFIVLK